MTKSVRQVRGQEVRASRGQVTGKNCVASVLGMEARQGSDSRLVARLNGRVPALLLAKKSC